LNISWTPGYNIIVIKEEQCQFNLKWKEQCRRCISPDCQSNAENAKQFTTKGLSMVGMVGMVGCTMVDFTMVMVSWEISLSASTSLRHHSR